MTMQIKLSQVIKKGVIGLSEFKNYVNRISIFNFSRYKKNLQVFTLKIIFLLKFLKN